MNTERGFSLFLGVGQAGRRVAALSVRFLFLSGFRGERAVGQDCGPQEYLHRHALLDGSGGHRLRREPRLHLRLQGNAPRCPVGVVMFVALGVRTCVVVR